MNTIKAALIANCEYSVLAWEPVAASGERLNVAVLYKLDDEFKCKTLIREDVLRCMYGEAGAGLYKMIESTIDTCAKVSRSHGLTAAIDAVPLSNLILSPIQKTLASSDQDFLRQVVLMKCSLSSIADEPAATSDDQPTSEQEVNKQWTTRIRDAIQVLQPDMVHYFNREAILVDNGVPVRFGVLTHRLAAHFGLLKPAQQNQGMEDARAKMWKLALAKERNSALVTALIYGTPKEDDITLSDRQHEKLALNVKEIQQEAVHRGITINRVHTVGEAAAIVVRLA